MITRPLAPHVAAALGVVPAPAATTTNVAGVNILQGVAAEAWQRFRLLPGLELSVSAEASAAVRSIAQKIYDDYVASASSSEHAHSKS